jgi:cysteine synthase A
MAASWAASRDRRSLRSRSIPGAFLPRQFSNDENAQAHFESTGPEIWWQLDAHNLVPDAFVAGVGTGGTVMGVGRFLRQRKPRVKIHPLEPCELPQQ